MPRATPISRMVSFRLRRRATRARRSITEMYAGSSRSARASRSAGVMPALGSGTGAGAGSGAGVVRETAGRRFSGARGFGAGAGSPVAAGRFLVLVVGASGAAGDRLRGMVFPVLRFAAGTTKKPTGPGGRGACARERWAYYGCGSAAVCGCGGEDSTVRDQVQSGR